MAATERARRRGRDFRVVMVVVVVGFTVGFEVEVGTDVVVD